jgi:transcriptional regulator with XRE-family HTH domain
MVMDICKHFGANVRRIRRAKEMSQEELAHRADIHRTYLASLESKGGRNPTIKVVERLARALDVTPGQLLD